MKPVRPKTPAKKFCLQKITKSTVKDPIEVFCRIRPLSNRNEMVCIKAVSSSTVILVPPDNLSSKSAYREVHYSFKYVFEENASQEAVFDRVSLPLIKDLLQGTNGLLFTYGITSSGKTYTMTGTPQDGGILPRSLDVLFNSIKNYQAVKYVFKPDKMNGFDIQSTSEALLDQQKEQPVYKSRQKKKEFLGEWSNRISDETKVEEANSDNSYAVFVSYVEIYNNYIYDLLEQSQQEPNMRSRLPQSKMLREDSTTHNMYVFGATEVEVKNADEALELFCRAQQHRRISNTALNNESSRSHSVFTVRVAQAPLDINGAEVIQDKSLMTVSQLSMVDLAGSERSIRTRNTGLKLREAGNINASLMALRTCIEVLRENQTQAYTKMVPYRESKLTHLFKTFFEGEGKIRMVVCVNPRADDYEETTHVMRFAEVTQDVMIPRGTPVSTPVNFGLKCGRGNLFREAVRKAKEEGVDLNEVLEPAVFSLGPEFPQLIIDNPDDEEAMNNLIEFLNARMERRNALLQDQKRREDEFRQNLLAVDKENISLKQENMVLQMDLNARVQQVKDLEHKLSNSEQTVHLVQQKLSSSERNLDNVKSELKRKEKDLSESEKEMAKMKVKMQERIRIEKDRAQRIMDRRLAEKQAELERMLCVGSEKIRQLREILNADDWNDFGGDGFEYPTARHPNFLPSANNTPVEPRMTRAKSAISSGSSQSKTAVSLPQAKSEPDVTSVQSEAVPKSGQQHKSCAVANTRHRRSQSSGDVWLEHNPVGNLELGTVLQPKMKKKKSVSKLEVKDVTKPSVSKYVLTHQEQDSQGEIETQLYKADVIPSAGGGVQVIFNDVEKLRQESPPQVSYNLRKRSAENMPLRNVEEKCAVAVECHGVPSKVRKEK